jgi:MoaA/NifB/PqqE/SkfB family radical SAM enzyme
VGGWRDYHVDRRLILLTYKYNLECDHCFLYSGPNARGTMTLPQVHSVLTESRKITSMKWIYFEGGEPFLFYPTLLEGVRLARDMGSKVGTVLKISLKPLLLFCGRLLPIRLKPEHAMDRGQNHFRR